MPVPRVPRRTTTEEAERAISEIALLAYRYFDRIAHSNAYGRKK
jgi:hypothetical protein